jgi:D-alanyl-D-alanine carboxypeptidase/D-alanyl-D-alanine-endopeptidase (penicillin-binding protein 4)
MKTGTLKRVKNIGGYVKSKEGKLYTVVILVETNKGRWKASALQNNIMKWLVTHKKTKNQLPIKENVETTPNQNSRIITTNMVYNSSREVVQKYYVQVDSFSNQPDKSYLLRLEHLGLPYRVRHIDTYKVLVGAFSTREDVQKALQVVRKNINKSAFIIRL